MEKFHNFIRVQKHPWQGVNDENNAKLLRDFKDPLIACGWFRILMGLFIYIPEIKGLF